MPGYTWPPIGSHYIHAAGKHTTTADTSSPYQNVASIDGVLSTDIVLAKMESLSAVGTPAKARFANLGEVGFELVAYYPGAAGNQKIVSITIEAVNAGQTPDLAITTVGDATGVGITVTPKASNIPYNTLVEALNAGVDGTYSTKVVDFTGTAHANFYFTVAGGTFNLAEDGESVTLSGGSDDNDVNLLSATPGTDQITFKFLERLAADHIISYIVLRAV